MVMENRMPASFSFASFAGKTEGQPVTWSSFSGSFTLAMNETMLRLVVDAIDGGVDHDGALEDDVCDLVETLERLIDREEFCEEIPEGVCLEFNGTYIFVLNSRGLTFLRDAVRAGAKFNEPGGQSLFALCGQCDGLVRPLRARQEESVAPAGYTPRKRIRKSEVVHAEATG